MRLPTFIRNVPLRFNVIGAQVCPQALCGAKSSGARAVMNVILDLAALARRAINGLPQ
jgi:hypothetical protein